MARRILGLGQAAQRVLLAIYRAGFPGQPPAVELAEHIGCARFWQAVSTICDKDLIPRRGGRLELTAAGRSAAVRIAPLLLGLFAALCVGCGAEFEAVEPETDPRVVYLIYGIYEAPPPDEVIEEMPRVRRSGKADHGQRRFGAGRGAER